jgi:hypothetical protein
MGRKKAGRVREIAELLFAGQFKKNSRRFSAKRKTATRLEWHKLLFLLMEPAMGFEPATC